MKNLHSLITENKPGELVAYINKHNIKLDGLSNITRSLIQDRYPDIEDTIFDAVDFIFWFSYLVERDAEDLIIEPEVSAGARRDAMKIIVQQHSFGKKIAIIKELYSSSKDPLIKIMEDIKVLRNKIAHGQIRDLKYKNYPLSDNLGKLMLIDDLRIALNKE